MDFERARFNMVEQQIRPWDVLDQEVLDLLFAVRREDFVPQAWRSLAFTDTEIPLVVDGVNTGESMLEPKVEARLIQALAVRRHEHVLEVGAGSGYMAALLAHRARHVMTYEIRPELARFARANLERAGVRNVLVETGNGAEPAGKASFEVIVLSGSVPFVPESMLRRLSVGGRLAAIVGEGPAMEAQVITRTTEQSFSAANLFETAAKPLTGFPVRSHFTF
ncbi:MAG: hypothetical protein RIS35_3377 [Pseudomonadota bacterium]